MYKVNPGEKHNGKSWKGDWDYFLKKCSLFVIYILYNIHLKFK